MNTSNRYAIEAMARQRQTEIEKQLRMKARLGDGPRGRTTIHLSVRKAVVIATISTIGVCALAVVIHVH